MIALWPVGTLLVSHSAMLSSLCCRAAASDTKMELDETKSEPDKDAEVWVKLLWPDQVTDIVRSATHSLHGPAATVQIAAN